MFIITHRKLFFYITGLILVVALAAVLMWGLPLGIDFTGGSLTQVKYENRPALSAIERQVADEHLGSTSSVRLSGTDAVTIRTRSLTPEEHTHLLNTLGAASTTPATGPGAFTISGGKATGVTELAFTTVGPALGSQFAHKALWAILAVILAIVLYIAWAFRTVSRPVPSWGYGLTVIAILLHDLIIPAGFFAILAHFTGVEVDALFVTALLALLGYSVNDTIIIFDRVREHLRNNEKTNTKETFEVTVGKSITETMTRSINTSLTVVLALLALIFLGAEATRTFALVMLVGVIAGTYSSILLAAPLLIPLARYFVKR